MIPRVLLILFLFFFKSKSLKVYENFPPEITSFCSRKLSVDGQIGCSSRYPSNQGVVFPSKNVSLVFETLQSSNSDLLLVIPHDLFINKTFMTTLRLFPRVSGVVVVLPFTEPPPYIEELKFSENSYCPNRRSSFYKNETFQCDLIPEWNPSASNYALLSWPFPVVLLIDRNDSIWNQISTCHQNLNENPVDDTRCCLEIRNYMSGMKSSQTCYDREVLLGYRLEQPPSLCSQIGGVNLMLRSSNITVNRNSSNHADSTLLLITRFDSLSMFDAKAASTFGVLPAISVLVSVAIHLLKAPAFKYNRLRKNVLFAFLDNEAYDFTGSQRLLFDLTNERLGARTGTPFSINSIDSVIELSEVGLSNDSAERNLFFLMADPNITAETRNITESIWKSLMDAAEFHKSVHFFNATELRPEFPLPPTVSLQAILTHYMNLGRPLSHTVIHDHNGPPYLNRLMDSFLDFSWPPRNIPNADEVLLNLANTLADAIHRQVAIDGAPMASNIEEIKPGELMNCLAKDPGCTLLRLHLEPEIIDFLLSLGGPIPTQGYEPINGREWRVSHVITRLLMGLTGDRLNKCPPISEYGVYTYMYGYYNGSQWCYRSLLDTSTSFFFLDNGQVAPPGWVRSSTFGNVKYIRLYRSSSEFLDKLSIGIGVFLTILAAVLGYFLDRFCDRLFPSSPIVVPVLSVMSSS